MPNNGSPAAPRSGAHDGPPPSGASQPGRREAAQCLSQFLDESTEVIHQCAREAGHPGMHGDRLPHTWDDPWGKRRRLPRERDCSWWGEHALGYAPPVRPLRSDPVAMPASLRYLRMDLLLNDPRGIIRVTGL